LDESSHLATVEEAGPGARLSLETRISGEMAYQRGTFTTQVKPKAGGEARTIVGKFLRIYRREPDGSWRMVIDMFN
jgi:ketosteroid isomerase-like protein